MSHWLTYSLADFLPFSEATYQRLFELYNKRFWLAVLIGLAMGLWLLRMLYRPAAPLRLACGILGVCWLWIAWAFFWESYAPLMWAAGYWAIAFAAQGVLLLALAAAAPRCTGFCSGVSRTRIGQGLLVFAVLLMPLLGLLGHQPWNGLGLFGSAPDPTAVATLGLLMRLERPRLGLLLMVVPALWSLFSGLTQLALDDPLWPLLPAAAVVAIAGLSTPWVRAGQSES